MKKFVLGLIVSFLFLGLSHARISCWQNIELTNGEDSMNLTINGGSFYGHFSFDENDFYMDRSTAKGLYRAGVIDDYKGRVHLFDLGVADLGNGQGKLVQLFDAKKGVSLKGRRIALTYTPNAVIDMVRNYNNLMQVNNNPVVVKSGSETITVDVREGDGPNADFYIVDCNQ